jgi:hypothetical protein
LLGTTCDYDFARLLKPLRPASIWWDGPPEEDDEDAADDEDSEGLASRLLVFGEQDFADGGGSHVLLALDATSGAIVGVDVEREPALLTFSSSAGRFVEMFAVLDEALRNGSAASSEVAERLRTIDPEGFASSEWHDLVVALRSE